MNLQCFAEFAPASIAHYLEHVWLGEPPACEPPSTGKNGAASSTSIRVADLAAYRHELLDAMVTVYGGDRDLHARALLSQWSKYYFGFAATAGFVAATLLRRPLAMALHETRVVLSDGLPVALHFRRDALQPVDADPVRRFTPLIDHLREVIEMLCAMTKISPRVLWSNAGNLLDYLFEQCTGQCTGQRELIDDAAWLFASCAANGEPNPLKTPVRLATPRAANLPNPFRARRVCCARNEIPGETQLCGSCPLLLTLSDAEVSLQLV